MSLSEQQNFLARLYTDENLRRRFFAEPDETGAENDLTEREIAELAEVLPEELNFFAESLVWKRLRAAEKFLPLTSVVLGEDFVRLFREFSQNYNPQTIKKHLADAIEFCRFLTAAEISGPARAAAKFEAAKLRFFADERFFSFCRLNYDVREISRLDDKSVFRQPKRKTKIAVWIRIGKRIRHFII